MRYLLLILLAVGILTAAAPAVAADFLPLVQCGVGDAAPCTPCELFATFKRAIDFVLIGLTGPVAAFMVVMAGGMMLLAGGRPALFAQGQRLLTNTLMGVTVILLAWVVTNSLIKSIGEGSGNDAWYQFSCPEFLVDVAEGAVGAPAAAQSGPGRPPAALVEAYQKVCTDKNALASNFGLTAAVERKNAPELDALIACLLRDPVLIVTVDRSQLYTYERSNPLCNLTRGFPVCGSCQHSRYSCHYGGRTGTAGALGVDFNWNKASVTYATTTRAICTGSACPSGVQLRTVTSEAALFDEIVCAAKRNNCEYGLINYEGNHTHVSTKTCDTDANDGIKGRTAPSFCQPSGSTP